MRAGCWRGRTAMGDHTHEQHLDDDADIGAVHEKILAVLVEHNQGYEVDIPALLQAIVIVAGTLDCDDCRRQFAERLERTPWLQMFEDAHAAYRAWEASGGSEEPSETQH
jgi:hypothetical protein